MVCRRSQAEQVTAGDDCDELNRRPVVVIITQQHIASKSAREDEGFQTLMEEGTTEIDKTEDETRRQGE